MFETGLVSISFRQLSPRQLAALCARNHLRWIEWGSDIHAPYCDTLRLTEIIALQEEFHLQCSSYGTYFKLGQDDTQELRRYIHAAKSLGTHILRLWCGSKNYEDMTLEERARILSESKKAAAIAEEAQVVLCLECHNNTFTNCLEGARTLMESVNSPAFRMYWQPNQFHDLEWNLEYARNIGKYTEIIHVFNWEGHNKYPLADACAIWTQYLACFDGRQKLLLEFMPDNLPESLETEAGSLERIRSSHIKHRK